MKNPKAVTCLLALLLPGAALSHETTLSTTEDAAIDAVIDPFLASLSGNSVSQGLVDLFATSSAVVSPDQVAAVTAKIEEASERYGAVQQCVLFDRQQRSPLLVQRKYMCQHRSSLSQWTFILLRLPDRWAVQGLNFNTDVDELFEQESKGTAGDETE